MDTDRIEKQVLLRAPIDRVWRAIVDADEFGRWFGARFEGPFVAGQAVAGTIVPTTVDEEVAAQQEPFAGARFEVQIEAIEPPRHLSFRWQPYTPGTDINASDRPMTLVTFDLEEAEGGTLLTIRETGFDALPDEHREATLRGNREGWDMQATLIDRYLSQSA